MPVSRTFESEGEETDESGAGSAHVFVEADGIPYDSLLNQVRSLSQNLHVQVLMRWLGADGHRKEHEQVSRALLSLPSYTDVHPLASKILPREIDSRTRASCEN
jgi:hypothetical protein